MKTDSEVEEHRVHFEAKIEDEEETHNKIKGELITEALI